MSLGRVVFLVGAALGLLIYSPAVRRKRRLIRFQVLPVRG